MERIWNLRDYATPLVHIFDTAIVDGYPHVRPERLPTIRLGLKGMHLLISKRQFAIAWRIYDTTWKGYSTPHGEDIRHCTKRRYPGIQNGVSMFISVRLLTSFRL
jgi:hypothetical protein